MSLRVVPVTAERWTDMCTLFERRGPRGGYRNVPAWGCWCMYWRDRSLEHGEPSGKFGRRFRANARLEPVA